MNNQNIRIGESIRAARISRGLTLSEVARIAGISRNAVWQIEMGKKSPTVTTFYKIGHGLQIDSWRIMRHAYRHRTKVISAEHTSLTVNE